MMIFQIFCKRQRYESLHMHALLLSMLGSFVPVSHHIVSWSGMHLLVPQRGDGRERQVQQSHKRKYLQNAMMPDWGSPIQCNDALQHYETGDRLCE